MTGRLPAAPAAVPLYALGGTTGLIGLDFDAKHAGPAAVAADVRRCVDWIRDCGGRVVVDHSTSGGQHVLLPLPIGARLGRPELEPLLRLLAERLPTLDITPMLNVATGCLTPPGSRTREGGVRHLTGGTLDDAVDTLTARSDHGTLGRLRTLLTTGDRVSNHLGGTVVHEPRAARAVAHPAPRTPRATPPDHAHLWEESGDRARLRARLRQRTPIPRAVRAFAVDGIPDDRWRAPDGRLDRSAARQAVLTAAVLRGMSLADIRAHLPAAGGAWTGFAAAYHRYGRGADDALRRDWNTACDWASRNAPEFLPAAHKITEHTGGYGGRRHEKQTRWLSSATVWVDAQWPRSARRWSVLAVLQALAHASTLTGRTVRGVPVVELGGRSLSLMASIPETTVWQVLRDLRELPGAPILRTRRAAGVLADQFALVTPRLGGRRIRVDPVHRDRVRVRPVHPAWTVLGMHCRRLGELILIQQMSSPADAIAAAGMSRSGGYAALARLATAGLISHVRGRITAGPATLDDIAAAHGLSHARTDRIARHRQQRMLWHAWLSTHFGLHTDPGQPHTAPAHTPASPLNHPENRPLTTVGAPTPSPPETGSPAITTSPTRRTPWTE
ncbi:hypothetical protein [Nocardia sp. alder85J]|uniref:hypothetical protein n=1 Tax=Nocardia sp. alder85J TaxID=2862949 RepID=UPI001CD216DA|nr:hypothetical protein [Nocardia sp. alder85J]MCX4097785.1 hypothetical protein [Nocardia sp. alder85J]